MPTATWWAPSPGSRRTSSGRSRGWGWSGSGRRGDPFDPNVHEALTHSLSAEVSTTTAVQVLQPGYRVGERVLRPARVAVADPDPDAPAVPTGEGADGDAAGAPEGAAGPSDGATVAGGEQQS